MLVRFAVMTVTIATVDLATKSLAPRWSGWSFIEPGTNPGVALGWLDVATPLEVVLMVVGLLLAGWWTLSRALSGKGRVVTTALITGGAAANLADRAVFGSVRDFLVAPWMVFNLADVFLVAGVCLLYLELLSSMLRADVAVTEPALHDPLGPSARIG